VFGLKRHYILEVGSVSVFRLKEYRASFNVQITMHHFYPMNTAQIKYFHDARSRSRQLLFSEIAINTRHESISSCKEPKCYGTRTKCWV